MHRATFAGKPGPELHKYVVDLTQRGEESTHLIAVIGRVRFIFLERYRGIHFIRHGADRCVYPHLSELCKQLPVKIGYTSGIKTECRSLAGACRNAQQMVDKIEVDL